MSNNRIFSFPTFLKQHSALNVLPLTCNSFANKDKYHFGRMLCKKALTLATPYLQEEKQVIETFLQNCSKTKKMNFCVIGAGPLFYLSLGLHYARNYIGIEPHIDQFIDIEHLKSLKKNSNIIIVSKSFEHFCQKSILKENKEVNTIYIFWFNVINYIQDPIKLMNVILKEGDIVIISGWNNSYYAKRVIKDYFKFVNGPDYNSFLPPIPMIKEIQINDINLSRDKNIFVGKTTEIWIIYT